MITKTCSIQGCDNKHYGKTYCKKHFQRWNKQDRPANYDGSKTRQVPANKGYRDPAIWTSTERRCSDCHEFKPFDEFHKNNFMPSGLSNVCKACSGLKYGEADMSVEDIVEYMHSAKHLESIKIEDGPLDTPCHVWQKSSTDGGYPQKGLKRRLVRPHRLALVVRLGRHIDPSMTASHLCHNSGCVNPLHLVEESQTDNLARKSDPIAMAKRAA